MRSKPKVGLLLLAADWFWKQGIQSGRGRYRHVPGMVESDVQAIRQSLQTHAELIRTDLIHTVTEAAAAVRTLNASEVDLAVICSVIWSEDAPFLEILRRVADVPLLIWCYVPTETLPDKVSLPELFRRSGPVGAVQHSAPLKRLGRKFGVVCGSPQNETALREIRDYAEAVCLAAELRRARIGLLPYRCDAMTGTHIDEFRFTSQLGLAVQCISIQEYASVTDGLSSARVAEFVTELRARYAVREVTDRSMVQTSKTSLGLARLAEELELDAVALNDLAPELHRVMKARPFLSVPEFFAAGRVLGMEGDLAATLGMLILARLSDSPPMYTEIFTFDSERNALLAGHAGMHDLRLAGGASEVVVTPDYEYCEANEFEGAWCEFRGRPGKVTLASFFQDVDAFKVLIAEGESLAEGPRLEGFAHLFIRLGLPVSEFFGRVIRSGTTQHWIVTHQDVKNKLQKLSEILGLRCELIA